MFLFLDNRVREVFLVNWREDNKYNADVIPLQLKTFRCLQWTLAWYEDLVEFNSYNNSLIIIPGEEEPRAQYN